MTLVLGLSPNLSSMPLQTSTKRGVTATFFRGNGTALTEDQQIGEPRTVETTDTAIKVNNIPIKPPEAKTAHFHGYLAVPTAGKYTFSINFDKQDAEAEFRLYHMPQVLSHRASSDGDSISQQTDELKPGVPYSFTFDIKDLRDGDVSLQVEAENLTKGSLSRLTLYPLAVVKRFTNAYVLLAKTLQLVQGLGLSEREARYFLAQHPYYSINFSKLPTIEHDIHAPNVHKLFDDFLNLADYAHLKRDLSPKTDDLISIFENSARTYPEITDENRANEIRAKMIHFKPLADLTQSRSCNYPNSS